MKILSNILLLLLLCISIKNEIIVIGYGSSSLSFMKDAIDTELRNVTYINLAKSGDIIETMAALQGANSVYIYFKKVENLSNSQKYNIDVWQKYNFGNLRPQGVLKVKLNNGVYGELDFRNRTFRYNGIENKKVGGEVYTVNFGFSEFSKNYINIICIGKNNIVSAEYTAEQIAKSIEIMTNYLSMHANHKFIVCGNFVDRESSLTSKKTILELNKLLKNKYQDKYFDMQDYLMSNDIWKNLSVDPTEIDLAIQSKGELAPSLSQDKKHLSNEVYGLMVKRMKVKLRTLNYL